jgi:carbon monoxide dehydrogenase subunit G
MFKIISIVVVLLIVAVLVFAATRPDIFRVQRSISIKAPPEKIFPLIDNFHNWASWSPYEKLDPAMKRTLSGSESGKGAAYAWESQGKAGIGRMEIADTAPPSKITIKLDFTKPFETHNLVDFTLQPQGDSTYVTWDMHGPSPYIAKLMGVFFDMDKMVGADFERGLASVKAIAEK